MLDAAARRRYHDKIDRTALLEVLADGDVLDALVTNNRFALSMPSTWTVAMMGGQQWQSVAGPLITVLQSHMRDVSLLLSLVTDGAFVAQVQAVAQTSQQVCAVGSLAAASRGCLCAPRCGGAPTM